MKMLIDLGSARAAVDASGLGPREHHALRPRAFRRLQTNGFRSM